MAIVTPDPSAQNVTWTLNGPGTLTTSAGASVTYLAPTSVQAVTQATVTATSDSDHTKSASVQITVNPPPQIPIQSIRNGTVGVAYNQTIGLTGGTAPFQWSVYDGPVETGYEVGGSIPDGLTLDAETGTVSGTPTAAGTWYFEATVTDADGALATNGFLNIQINPVQNSANPVPFLNQTLVPTAVSPGTPGAALNMSGTGFVSGATVDWNGDALATTFVSSEHLTAALPAANLANAATASITVVNPPPGGGRSNVVYLPVGSPEASVSFIEAANSPLSFIESFGIAAADFNEDGKPDLVIAAPEKTYVLPGNGNGTFTQSASSVIPMPSPPYDDFPSPYAGPAIAVGDFNNSGHQGLAIGLFQNDAAVTLFGNGDGTFSYANTLANTAGGELSWLTAADFNHDGNLDLVAINAINGESPVTLLGYGHGAFNGFTPLNPVYGQSSAAGDFNGDGKLDLVVDGTNILLGDGDGTFEQSPTSDANGLYVTVADFNGDGKLDLAVSDYETDTVTILLGDGSGGFAVAAGSPIPVGKSPTSIVAADLNNDGKLDLAIANSNDNTITILLGNGDGTFTPDSGSPFAVGRGPTEIAVADFNGDGKLDLAVLNETDGTVSILLQP
jgi:FG-GAP-like repeat/Putative Ig domain